MTDPRIERLAELLCDYSLGLQPGHVFRIDGTESSAKQMVALQRAALRRGAHVYTNLRLEVFAEHLLTEASEEQLTYVSPSEWKEIELIDALVTLWSENNTRALSRVDEGRNARLMASRRDIKKRFWERFAEGQTRWCGTLVPTHAHAQDAEMSLSEYEDFVYGACHVLDGDDAVAFWEERSRELTARAAELSDVRELRVVGPDTDLRVDVEGRRWLAADGKLNMPDGEVYTSPVESGTEGEIRFTFPAIYGAREVEDVRLRFEGGKVVSCEASRGADYLRSLLAMDDGAPFLGEVAFGLNYEIDRFTRNILFDEKIGGTMHFALGSSFPEAGGENVSGLHWDMICDLRQDGEVYADGELIWRAGAFVGEPVGERVG